MERIEKLLSGYSESLHLPFSSPRRQLYVPDTRETTVAPSYHYLSARLFTLSHGFLVCRESLNVISLDFIPTKRMDSEKFKKGDFLAGTRGNGIDLIFQAQLVPKTCFREVLSQATFAIYACTDQSVVYTILFETDKQLVEAYKETVATALALTSSLKVFTLLPNTAHPKDDVAAIADDRNSLHTFRLVGGEKVKADVSVSTSTGGLVSFFKSVVGKGSAAYVPVAMEAFGSTGIAVLYSNYELVIWDLLRRVQIARTTLLAVEDTAIEKAKMAVRFFRETEVVLTVGYSCGEKSDWGEVEWGRPFTHFLEPKHELKDLYLTPNTLMALVAGQNSPSTHVLSIPISMEEQPEKVYPKDLQWELYDAEDLQNTTEFGIEDESIKRTFLAKKSISRATVPDRFKREEVIEAMQSLGLRTVGSATNLTKELEGKIGENPEAATALLENVKGIHKSHAPALGFGFVDYPTPLLAIVRAQGFSLCAEVEGLDKWACDVSEKTVELLRVIKKSTAKVWFLGQVTLMWNNTDSMYDKWILILALLNLIYTNSYYFFDKYMKDGQSLHEVVQAMLLDNNNTMQYEIESLINSLLRSNKHLLFVMLDQFHRLLNNRIEAGREYSLVAPGLVRSTSEISTCIVEFLASWLRQSSKSLYSMSRLIYVLLETITTKQRDEYLDVYTTDELKRLEVEILPRLEPVCVSSLAVHYGLTRTIDWSHLNPVGGFPAFSYVDTTLTVSSLVALDLLHIFTQATETHFSPELYKVVTQKLLAISAFFLPWERRNDLPFLMRLLAQYREFETLRNIIRITKEKTAIFNFMSLYCNVEIHDVKETQKCIVESAAYHRIEDPFCSNTVELISFIDSLNLTNADLSGIIYQNPEFNYYAICLETMRNLDPVARSALLNAILWSRVNNPKDYDVFWGKLAELLSGKKLYLKAYQAIQSIVDKRVMRGTLGRFVDVVIADKKLATIRDEVPLPGLKHEIIKYLRQRANEQTEDYEQLLRQNAVDIRRVGQIDAAINYATVLYTFLVEDSDYIGAAELMITRHNKSLQYLRQASESVESLYTLLMVQKKSLLLCLNALAMVDEDQAVVSIVEDGLGGRKKRGRELDTDVNMESNSYDVLNMAYVEYRKSDIIRLLAICKARIRLVEEGRPAYAADTKDILKELLVKKLYLNAVEVAGDSPPILSAVLEEMIRTIIVEDNEACYTMLEFDKKGNLSEAEGSETIKSACWVQVKKILEAHSNDPTLVEAVGNAILSCDPDHKIPEFVKNALDPVSLTHLYLNYGRIEDAAGVLLAGLEKRQYMDPVLYAKVCEGLRNIEREDKSTAQRVLERLEHYH